jgi:hypothetical protein
MVGQVDPAGISHQNQVDGGAGGGLFPGHVDAHACAAKGFYRPDKAFPGR